MKVLDLIETLLCKISGLFYKEYSLKLEDYCYDYNKNLYIVVLRFRNKNAIITSSILDIVKNKSLINSLHPYDSYVIGTLSSMQANRFVTKTKLVERDYDDYYIIEPCVEWLGTDFIENKLVFKPHKSAKCITVSIENFCKDFQLMRALSSASTFLIGSIVTNSFIQTSAY